MKSLKIIGNILFYMTIISLPLSFSLSSIIGEVDIFRVAGIIRYSWIMLLFVPIGIACLFVGRKLKYFNEKYKKNYIVAFICIPLLLIFGSYRFIFSNIKYDSEEMSSIENNINLNLPNNVKIATNKLELYTISYAKILDQEEKDNFQNEIINSNKWCETLTPSIYNVLPLDIQMEIENFDYFVFYNKITNDYNVYHEFGEYECIFIAYDSEIGKLILLNEYTI